MKFVKILSNNRGMGFIEALLILLLVVFVIAVPVMDLSSVISDIFSNMINRVGQIGTP